MTPEDFKEPTAKEKLYLSIMEYMNSDEWKEADEFAKSAAKFYHTVYTGNFYNQSCSFQRKWILAMKNMFVELGKKYE